MFKRRPVYNWRATVSMRDLIITIVAVDEITAQEMAIDEYKRKHKIGDEVADWRFDVIEIKCEGEKTFEDTQECP